MVINIVSTGKRGVVGFTGETSPQLGQTMALARGRRCRSHGACADERKAQGDTPEGKERARVLQGQWGCLASSEFVLQLVGAEEVHARNRGSLVARREE